MPAFDTAITAERSPVSGGGLSAAEVRERLERGDFNDVPVGPTRTVAQIVRASVLTRFNALLGSCWSSSSSWAAPGRVVRRGLVANSAIGRSTMNTATMSVGFYEAAGYHRTSIVFEKRLD